jgi:hypothetical protein
MRRYDNTDLIGLAKFYAVTFGTVLTILAFNFIN